MKKPAVLFDLGNVLVHLRMDRGLRRFLELAGVDGIDVYLGDEADAYSTGQLSPQDFFAALSRKLGRALPFDEAAAAWCDIFEPWPEMEALAAEVLASGHAAYILSNTDPLHFAAVSKRMPVLARMTGHHLSYEIGFNKPDPRFYRTALDRFGLAPGDACFVDDRPDNVQAALALGIASFVHLGDPRAVRAFLQEQGVGV